MRLFRPRRGFTLIEVLIAIVIGTFVIAGLYQLFRTQMRQFVYQDLQMEMHQNARLAADILTRSSRMAGTGTASGFTYGAFGDQGNASSVLSAVIHRNNVGANGSDVITLVSMDPSLVINTSAATPPSCNTTNLEFSPTALHNAARLAQYQNGEMVMCYDPASIGGYRSYLWTLTADGDPTGYLYVADNTGLTDYDNVCGGSTNLPLIMSCSRAEIATFYIDATDDGIGAGTPQRPVLMMDLDFESPDEDDVPVVDNVEDMQLAFCLQDNFNLGNTDCTNPALWTQTLTESQVPDVYMIRVSFVVRSSREDIANTRVSTRPPLEDNAGASDSDMYYRQVLSTEVLVRNIRMQAQLYP